MQVAIKQVLHTLPTEVPRPKIIGTHDGTFHCDEALACGLLSLTSEFQDAVVVRSRDPQLLSECDVLCDVGAVYDPTKSRFDHHQATFVDKFSNETHVKLSSAGLIYKHYGRDIIRRLLTNLKKEKYTDPIYDRMYSKFIEHIDGIDNGHESFELIGGLHEGQKVRKNYRITTCLSSRVARLNPSWTLSVEESRRIENDRFLEAVRLTLSEFLQAINGYLDDWLPARSLVEESYNKKSEIDPSAEILQLTSSCPWKEHLIDIEKERGELGKLKYVLYPDLAGRWRIQCVPLEGSNFQNRLSLPKSWRGLRDEVLSKKIGIPGAVFVHASGFIGGNLTRDGALQMARAALVLARSDY